MSSPADVVHDLLELLAALTALLQTDTAKEAPAIARDLGAQPQFAQGVDAVAGALKTIRKGVAPLRDAIISADAIVALVGFVPAMVSAVGDAIQSSGQWLDQFGLGLSSAAGPLASVTDGLHQISGILDIGVDVGEAVLDLLAPGQWGGVVEQLDRLILATQALKIPPALPAS